MESVYFLCSYVMVQFYAQFVFMILKIEKILSQLQIVPAMFQIK